MKASGKHTGSSIEKHSKEYKDKCLRIKKYYRERIRECEKTNDKASVKHIQKSERDELQEIDRQYRLGKPLKGNNVALSSD